MQNIGKKIGAIAALVVTCAVPVAAVADGHTADYPGNKGYVGAKGYVVEKTYKRKQVDAYHGWNRKKIRNVQVLAAPGCPPRFNGLFRGTLYCVDGHPVQ